MKHPQEPSPLQQLHSPLYSAKQVQVFMKRDDLLHPHVQGNKWRKLKYNLSNAVQNGFRQILTFGGYYSNHIYATAAAANMFGLKSVGVIRGEQPSGLSETLRFAKSEGMLLKFVSRETYINKHDPEFTNELKQEFGDFYIIPEGGTNELALKGVSEIIEESGSNFDVVCTACGTGGTLAGLAVGMQGRGRILGFSSLRGEDHFAGAINRLTTAHCGKTFTNFFINRDYHFGGYARWNDELLAYIRQFKMAHHILLDPVYTSKMMFGVDELIAKNAFAPGSKLLCVHTGGLQGWCGVRSKDDLSWIAEGK